MRAATPATTERPRLVEEVYQPGAVTVDFYERLTEVARRMRDEDIGAVIVVEDGETAGILTERDLVQAVADGVALATTIAADYMMTDLLMVELDTSLEEAGRLMAAGHVRHLPVADGGGLLGMVSARDLVGLPGDGS